MRFPRHPVFLPKPIPIKAIARSPRHSVTFDVPIMASSKMSSEENTELVSVTRAVKVLFKVAVEGIADSPSVKVAVLVVVRMCKLSAIKLL